MVKQLLAATFTGGASRQKDEASAARDQMCRAEAVWLCWTNGEFYG